MSIQNNHKITHTQDAYRKTHFKSACLSLFIFYKTDFKVYACDTCAFFRNTRASQPDLDSPPPRLDRHTHECVWYIKSIASGGRWAGLGLAPAHGKVQ